MVLFIVAGIFIIKCVVLPTSLVDASISCSNVNPLSYYTLVEMGVLEMLVEIGGIIKVFRKKG